MDDLNKIPETMEEVQARVTAMTQAGFPVSEDDVIKEAIKNGFQSLMDERMEGHYYTIHWNSEFTALDVFGSAEEMVGSALPEKGQASWVDQFKANADFTWFNLDKAAGKLIGR